MNTMKFLMMIACLFSAGFLACKTAEPVVLVTPTPVPPVKTPVTGATNEWYVAANGLTTNDGRSAATPKGNIREVSALTKPGDIVNIMSTGGEFKRIGTSGAIVSTTVSGSPGQYITFRGYPVGGPKPVIRGYSMFSTVSLSSGVGYLKFENLEIAGDLKGEFGGPALTLAGANAVYDRVRPLYVADGKFTLTAEEIAYQTSGITTSGNCHHIEIRNCKIHDLPGGGIATNYADYITVEDNEVYNTASLSLYGMSGISYLRPYNFDAHTAGEYHIIIRRNVSYSNSSQAKCYTKTGAALTDGNGIICDITENYSGKALVENNISHNNGAGGIHLVGAANVDVINNTAYNNGQLLAYAEMDASYGSKNIRFINNIMSAKTGGKCIDNSYTDNNNITLQNVNVVYVKNVMHNGNITPRLTAGFTNTDFTTGNPQFKNTTPGPAFDLRLDPAKTPVSSAANFGSGKPGEFSVRDFLGNTRQNSGINGQLPDCGAYESF